MVFPVVVLVFDFNESSEGVLHGHSISMVNIAGCQVPIPFFFLFFQLIPISSFFKKTSYFFFFF
jgi:hypothetical protein